MATIINPNWYDQNADRAYPFLDSAVLASTDGAFTIPNDLIVDLRISAPPNYTATKFFVSRIQSFGSGLIITISVDGTGEVATAAVPSANFTEFTSFLIAGLPDHVSVSGTIVLGPVTSEATASAGDFSFDAASTPLIPTLITPALGGVTSITIRDSFGAEARLTGEVELIEGNNATIGVAAQEISIGMDSGVIVGDPCGLDDPGGRSRTAIRTINGVGPDGSGNIEIDTVGCPEISEGSNRLTLTDRCAEPCCGDAEIAALAENTQDIDRYLADLANRAGQLESSVRAVEVWLAQ